jgi:DNA (cytosine-5)-methyltransferase 1
MNKLSYIDLFCGIGGFRQALDSRGHQCVFSSDWDPHAQWVYQKNYGETPFGDVSKLPDSEVPVHDLLCGGFPCQPFSISGNQLGFEDARGTLLHEILRIVKVRKPAVVLLENVKNYRTHDLGRTHAMTLELLGKAGYSVFDQILNSSNFGVPQKRERLFFVGFRKDLQISQFIFPSPSSVDIALEDILLPEEDPCLEELIISRDDVKWKEKQPATRKNRPLRIGTVGKGGQGERIYSVKGHAVTLSAYGGGIGAKTGMYLVGNRIRRLHPEECKRVMGFPKEFILHEKRNVSYKQFGNSVAVPVISAIAERIENVLTIMGKQVA